MVCWKLGRSEKDDHSALRGSFWWLRFPQCNLGKIQTTPGHTIEEAGDPHNLCLTYFALSVEPCEERMVRSEERIVSQRVVQEVTCRPCRRGTTQQQP